MSAIDSFILKVKRAETPFFRSVKKLARTLLRAQAPRMPQAIKPALRALYELHYLVIQVVRAAINICYRHPLFQGRCASFGENVSIDGMVFVSGHVQIHIGNNVWLGGGLDIMSGKWVDAPKLILKDYAEIGWNVRIAVNREIVLEEHARVASDCRISDSDGHPREADLRRQNAPVDPKDIRPVRIGRDAWIGAGTHIMKGVTIGEGAIVGANSVVITDIPPYCLALGNPAEVYFKNFGKPKVKKTTPVPEPVSEISET